jgi:hypothetical protein
MAIDMDPFQGVPVFDSSSSDNELQHIRSDPDVSLSQLRDAIAQNKLVLLRSTPFTKAGSIFRRLAASYGLEDSYDLQMQYVVKAMKDRAPVGNLAVTVNERGPLQIIQPHSEGDSTSQLDLFGLHCTQNAMDGGENILSLIDQRADHSRLRAKEKAILGTNLSPGEIYELQRKEHLDARAVISDPSSVCRVLKETPRGSVVVRFVPIAASRSVITNESLFSYWDNVTVHDRAFHRHQYELLRHLAILQEGAGPDYAAYMHVEDDSPWRPADTDSGDIAQTAGLFRCHVVHKLAADDFLIFNNRAWTHAVNNWPPAQARKLTAMYA